MTREFSAHLPWESKSCVKAHFGKDIYANLILFLYQSPVIPLDLGAFFSREGDSLCAALIMISILHRVANTQLQKKNLLLVTVCGHDPACSPVNISWRTRVVFGSSARAHRITFGPPGNATLLWAPQQKRETACCGPVPLIICAAVFWRFLEQTCPGLEQGGTDALKDPS